MNPRNTAARRFFRSIFVVFLGFVCFGASVPVSLAQNDPQNAALLSFKRQQIALTKAEIARDPLYWREFARALEQFQDQAARIEKATGDAADTPFSLQERAYFAPDGSAQPFWIFLPRRYSARKKWPLLVYLHGYSTATSIITPSFPGDEWLELAAKRGFVVAIPYGRRNSDFVQWGEDDALRVKAETLSHYSIDENRVALAGVSMGGYGAYAVGLHTAGQWNGVIAVSGRSDFYLWFNTKRAEIPAWKRALFDADDPRFLVRNARGTPFFVAHGALDATVPLEHARRWVSDARALGLPVTYFEQETGTHSNDFQTVAAQRAFDWLQKLPPRAEPRQLELVAVDLREANAYWARIEAFQNYGEKAVLKAQIEDGRIDVQTENVARFVLELPPRVFRPGRLISLRVDGIEEPKLFDPFEKITWEKAGAAFRKSPARCGPFKNALRDPFLLVYGDEKDEQDARRFALEWQDASEGAALLKPAALISEADKASFNLILFGTRASNPLLAQISEDLPLEITPSGYRSGKNLVPGENLGLRMVRPSPWNEKRLIGVCSGVWWGERLPINHKWDLIPDFIVYEAKTERDETNTAREAGFFDGNWEMSQAQLGLAQ